MYTMHYYEENYPALDFKIAFNKDGSNVGENEMAVKNPNRIQLGLNIAAGIVVEPVPHQKFMFTVRYEFGHSFFSRESNGIFPNTFYEVNPRARSQGGRISLFYFMDTRVQERKKGKSTSHIKSKGGKRR